MVGLLGPNGAGKSTLMRILATVTRATTGHVRWNGVDIARSPDEVRKVLGYLPQDFGVYPNLNPVEFLTCLAAARGIGGRSADKRINDLLELVNLVDARKRSLGSLSGEMKQRVGIAQALLNNPKLLIVDVPTAGLDPEERARFRNLLTELAAGHGLRNTRGGSLGLLTGRMERVGAGRFSGERAAGGDSNDGIC